MLPRSTTGFTTQASAPFTERRRAPREPVFGCLWMIDSRTATVLRCRCADVSRDGMRLRVPVGYGVREGQIYELTSHLPGQSSPPGLGLMVSRRARVVRTRIVAADDEYDVEVGVELAAARSAVLSAEDDWTTGPARTSAPA